MASPFQSRSSSAAPSQWPGRDVSLSDFTAESLRDDGEVDRSPHWLWCLLSTAGGNQVWVHSPVENHPDGLRYRPAGPLPAGDAGIRVYSGATEIRLRKTGLVSSEALVLGARGGDNPVPIVAQPASTAGRRRRGKAKRYPPPDPLLPDSVVHQRMDLVPEPMFLRMAKDREFPSFREKQLVCAHWKDVEQALKLRADREGHRTHGIRGDDEGRINLDDLRRRAGLVPKDE
jgi:hypothetical protein